MAKYICAKCGYIVETDKLSDDYVCPMCESAKDEFKLVTNDIFDQDDLDSVIDSVVEEALDIKTSKIVNDTVEDKKVRISQYNPAIVRIPEKCINCGQCKKTCEKVVNLSYDLNVCKNPICLGCGQCILNCPTGAIVPRYCYKEVKEIINTNEKVVVAMIAPAVRVAIGESFGMEPGENAEYKMVTALKKIGFDYVFDTAFGADLTIMEEVAEFASRLTNNGPIPQFTSCCPAWVKYCEVYHPELLDNLSTCKSPIGMQCAIIKEYFSKEKNIDPSKIVTVAITPCTSKKMEAREYTINIDYVMTTSELSILFKEEDIKLATMNESEYDKLIGEGSGGGVIFGNSGGVTESVIRTLYRIMTKTNLKNGELNFSSLRGFDGIKEANIDIKGYKLNVAVVQQLENLEELLKDGKYKKYHFIEVMNCKGGCIGGGGQPLCQITQLDKIREKRSKGLYDVDNKRAIRAAHDNKEIKLLYKNYLKKPLSEESFKLLHTSYSNKSHLLRGEEK